MTRVLSSMIEMLGLAVIITGAAMIDYRAGLIVGGVALIVIAWAMDRPARRTGAAAVDGEANR